MIFSVTYVAVTRSSSSTVPFACTSGQRDFASSSSPAEWLLPADPEVTAASRLFFFVNELIKLLLLVLK